LYNRPEVAAVPSGLSPTPLIIIIIIIIIRGFVQKSQKAITAVRDHDFEKLNQLTYNPDMAVSDYFLFCKLKKHV
jgi:hypothetical protein